MTLREIILDTIRREGPIPFSRYMALCLYHPELGYYSRPREKAGTCEKAGSLHFLSPHRAGRVLARMPYLCRRCPSAMRFVRNTPSSL